MTPEVTLLLIRALFVLLFYLFLAQLLVLLRRDLALAAQSGRARLVVLDAPDAALVPGTALEVLSGDRIGRSPAVEVALGDEYASAEHARLVLRGGTWQIEDLGSTNGTFINGHRLRRTQRLYPGDTLQIGRTILRFDVVEA
jgi:pSer/pThr/pTyr-binding forkhead associated (FHA) protein